MKKGGTQMNPFNETPESIKGLFTGNKNVLRRLNNGINETPKLMMDYAKNNPKQVGIMAAKNTALLGGAGYAASQIAKTSPNQYAAAERNDDGSVTRSTGRSVDRLTGVSGGIGSVPAYKLMQQVKDNNKLGVKETDTHAQADTKLGLLGGATAGLGAAMALPWAMRKGRIHATRFAERNFEEGSGVRRMVDGLSDASKAVDGTDLADTIAENGSYVDVEAANALARKFQGTRLLGATGAGAGVGALHGYRNGIYEDEMDKKELAGKDSGNTMMMRKRASTWFEGLDDDQRKKVYDALDQDETYQKVFKEYQNSQTKARGTANAMEEMAGLPIDAALNKPVGKLFGNSFKRLPFMRPIAEEATKMVAGNAVTFPMGEVAVRKANKMDSVQHSLDELSAVRNDRAQHYANQFYKSASYLREANKIVRGE